MSGTTQLSADQEKFLSKYLRSNPFDRKKIKEKNAATRAAYQAAIAAQKALGDELNGVPNEYAAAANPAKGDAETALATNYKKSQAASAADQFDVARSGFEAALAAFTAVKSRAVQQRTALETRLAASVPPAWAAGQLRTDAEAERQKARTALAPALPTRAQLDTAKDALDAFDSILAPGKAIIDRRNALERQGAALTDPASATERQKKTAKTHRDALAAALAAPLPNTAGFDAAERALAGLRKAVGEAKAVEALAARNPAAGQAAKAAFDAYSAQLDAAGIGEVTEAVVVSTKSDADAAKALLQQRTAALASARTAAKGQARGTQARTDLTAAIAAKDAAASDYAAKEALRRAAVGQRLLGQAVSHGPLSAESGRPLSDGTARNLLDAFKDDPELADLAARNAASSAYPDAIGDRIGWATQQARSGFRSATGRAFKEDHARTYAGRLLAGCGHHGPDYANGLDQYIAAGEQFTQDPFNEAAESTLTRSAQRRAAGVTTAMIDPATGTIDATTPAATKAMRHARFNPECVKYPMPGLTGHMMQTAAFFQDDANRIGAQGILASAGPPAGDAAATMVRAAVGKPPGEALGAADTRVAVMAAMFMPIRQGSVGSCFATGPVIRQRALDPLGSMAAMAQIAGRGTYKGATGGEVAAVTRTGADGNPLTRSLEYSVATAVAREKGHAEKSSVDKRTGKAIDALNQPPGMSAKRWDRRRKQLKADVAAAFTLVYDPDAATPLSADGSSSQGIYVLVRISDGKEIRSEAEFKDAVAELAVARLQPADPAALRTDIDGPAFTGAVSDADFKPWALEGGGQLAAPYQIVFGKTETEKRARSRADKAAPPPEGERTASVLGRLVSNLDASSTPMPTISTDTHVFNALPSPALRALAKDGKFSENIKAALIDPGAAIAGTDLSADRAAWMFDQELARTSGNEKDPARKALLAQAATAGRPGASMKPADLALALEKSLAPYHDRLALDRATLWADNQARNGPRPDAGKVTAKQDEERAKAKKATRGGVASLLFQDFAVPEVVVADTNWGSLNSSTLMTIAPDPITGELAFWQKVVPPGTVSRMDRKWADSQWDVMRS